MPPADEGAQPRPWWRWEGPETEPRCLASYMRYDAPDGEMPLSWLWTNGLTVWFVPATPAELERHYQRWPADRPAA